MPVVLGIILAATIMPLDRGSCAPRDVTRAVGAGSDGRCPLVVIGIIALTIVSLAGPANDMIQVGDRRAPRSVNDAQLGGARGPWSPWSRRSGLASS